MKILFFVNYSITGPSSRYRIHNYIDKYKKVGIECGVSYFWGDFYTKKIISEKNKIIKLFYLCFYYPFCIIKRYFTILKVVFYDVIHIERDFCPGIPPIGEFIISKLLNKKLVFEFDDAVYLSNKPKGKTEKVIKMSKGVIVGNKILEAFASNLCNNIIVIPTPIDLEKYINAKSIVSKDDDIVIIGWIGTFSTIKYLEIVKEVLKELAKVYSIELNVVCNRNVLWDNELKINNIKWDLNTYISEICKFDIGIMPLYDNEWEKGKCGFKLIQYMGVGIPVVASPVGVNCELVKADLNGYLAQNYDEWYNVLEKLIKDEKLRRKLGTEGLLIVEKKYSVSANMPLLVDFFKEIKAKD